MQMHIIFYIFLRGESIKIMKMEDWGSFCRLVFPRKKWYPIPTPQLASFLLLMILGKYIHSSTDEGRGKEKIIFTLIPSHIQSYTPTPTFLRPSFLNRNRDMLYIELYIFEIMFVLPVLYSLEEVSTEREYSYESSTLGDSCRRGVTNFYSVDLIWLLTVKGILYHRNFFRPCKTRLWKTLSCIWNRAKISL